MNQKPIYDSRDTKYKTPYGAVPTGTVVQFTLRPKRADGFPHARLIAEFESRGGEPFTCSMHWNGQELDRDLFRASLDTEGYVGLVWYSFVLESDDGPKQTLGPYQLTVYDPADRVPTWSAGS